MIKYLNIIIIILILTSCEEVIDLDLNTAEPVFVVEGTIYKDSVCTVLLSQTTGYFSNEAPVYIDDAIITISDGSSSEMLEYKGDGLYKGNSVLGMEGGTYELEISYEGKIYQAESTMPELIKIDSVKFTKDNSASILNPEGETVFTITVELYDNPDQTNYYMITFIDTSTHKMIEERYFLFSETSNNGGSISFPGDNRINFSESIFYEGGIVEVNLFSIDEQTYSYFIQLDDILFWKRRVMPPVPYNADSNILNGTLGHFAALGYDHRIINLN